MIVAETIRLAAQTGIVGGSVEDVSTRANPAIYEIAHAADRVRAASEVVRALPFRFTLTARAENYLVGKPDLRDTIKRLQAYQEAGADVLYAPGLTSKADISAVVRSLDRPVNVIMGLQGVQLNLAELSSNRSEAHQRRQRAFSRRVGRFFASRPRNARTRHLHFFRGSSEV